MLKKRLSFLLHRSTDPGDTDVVIENVMEDGSTGQYAFCLLFQLIRSDGIVSML